MICPSKHTAFVIVALVGLLFVTTERIQAEIAVLTDFPGGSGVVGKIDQQTGHIRLDPTDHVGRGWRCWWSVKLTGLTPGKTISLDVGSAPWATPDQATFSIDGGKTWLHTAKGTRTGKRIRYELRSKTDSILVAWGPPFVPADAEALVTRLAARSPDATAFTLCRTRENRNTPALRATRNDRKDTHSERPLIWIQARAHAWESGASWVAKGLAEWIVSDAAEAVRLRTQNEIVIVPIVDIDNVQRGAGGKNQQPQDHNRDWSDKPHWRAVAAAQNELRAAAASARLAAFVDLHNPGANDRQPYFYVPPKTALSTKAQSNLAAFLKIAKAEITGPLRFTGRAVESGPKYDPKAWMFISKNWVARLGTPAVSVTLETAWNTPASTTQGYETVGRQLGITLARYVDASSNAAKPETR